MIITYENKRQYGHHQGHCLYNKNVNLAYVNISKNASSNIKEQLNLIGGFSSANFRDLDSNTKFISVLRDPLERWYSGIYEYAKGRSLMTDDWFFRVLCDGKVFDEHTEKQVWFLEGLDTDNVEFFYLDNTFTDRWNKYWNVPIRPLKYKENEWVDALRKFTKEHDIVGDLKSFYKEDYNLINAVTFKT